MRHDTARHTTMAAFVSGQGVGAPARRERCGEQVAQSRRVCARAGGWSRARIVRAGDSAESEEERVARELAEVYARIDASALNAVFMRTFARQMAAELGAPPSAEGYAAVVELARRLVAKLRTGEEISAASRRILDSLFPAWFPAAFKALFARPLPRFSLRMNALVTVAATQWLMGPSALEDDGLTVKVERCRFLEQTGCVSVCVNACKRPTQAFFEHSLGIHAHLEPDYNDFSCKFKFGERPPPEHLDDALRAPCLAICPNAATATATAAAVAAKMAAKRDAVCPKV